MGQEVLQPLCRAHVRAVLRSIAALTVRILEGSFGSRHLSGCLDPLLSESAVESCRKDGVAVSAGLGMSLESTIGVGIHHATTAQVGLAVLLGSLFLGMFYKAVSVQWPESYFAASDTGAYSVSSSPLRYLGFRFLPVYATCLFVAVSVKRLRGPSLIAALLVAAIHGTATVGIAVARDLRAPKAIRRHRAPVTLLRTITLATVFAVAVAADASKQALSPLVPSLHELAATLWTGAIAAVAGVYALALSRGRTNNPSDLVEKSFKSIPRSLVRVAKKAAADFDSEPELVLAVMTAENLQRPRWFRKLERLKSLVLPSGTYGIMQVQSDRYLGDEESIRLGVRDRLASQWVCDPSGKIDYERLKQLALAWNPDPTYDQLLINAYYYVRGRDSLL